MVVVSSHRALGWFVQPYIIGIDMSRIHVDSAGIGDLGFSTIWRPSPGVTVENTCRDYSQGQRSDD